MAANSRSASLQRDVATDRAAAWTRGYVPLADAPDEFIGPDGAIRPHWRHLLNGLAALEQDALEQRFAAADRRIRNMGMSYRVQGESAERIWPLSRMPLLISQDDWREIARGVEQRAELFERVLGDLYGEGALVRRGPAARRRGHRIDRLPRRDARREAAGQALAAPLRRRHRTRTRRALVGARRPHPGAVRLGLCAGEPAGRFAGLPEPLQRNERRAAGAVLPRIARRAADERRALGAAHLHPDARPVERRPISSRPISRAISAFCWSRATIS